MKKRKYSIVLNCIITSPWTPVDTDFLDTLLYRYTCREPFLSWLRLLNFLVDFTYAETQMKR